MFKPRGIIPPVVTPFHEDGSVNFPAYETILRHLIDSGVHGVFPFGTTGEFYAVEEADYRRLLEKTVEIAAGRVAVYAGANDITTRGVIRRAKLCESVPGIDALSVLTPMFVSQTQEEIYRHYRSIAEATSLPIIVYNNRPKTNVTVAPETMARLAEIPNIIGVKDSTGDMTNTLDYLRLTAGMEDFSVLMGRDTLIYSALCAGAAGSIASCANVAPRLVVEIYERFRAGDWQGSLAAQMELFPLRLACSMGTFPEVIKEALMMEGFDSGCCLAPIGELRPEEKEKLRAVLRKLELLPERAGEA